MSDPNELKWLTTSNGDIAAESVEGGATYHLHHVRNGNWQLWFQGLPIVDGGFEKCFNAVKAHHEGLLKGHSRHEQAEPGNF